MAERSVLLISHLPYDTAGHSTAALADLPTSAVAFPEVLPPLDRVAGIVAFGGKMGAHETSAYPSIGLTIDLLRRAVDADVPVLGLCLGHQMLGVALGAAQHPNAVDEAGLVEVTVHQPDPFLGGRTGELRALEWHHDTVDLPAGATLLASNDTCANQGFRYGSAVGLQFHLEVNQAMLDIWLDTQDLADELPEGVTAASLRADYAANDALHRVAQAGFGAFADACRVRRG